MTTSARRRLVYAALCLLTACGSGASGDRPAADPKSSSVAKPRVVRTAKFAEESWERTIEVPGELIALENSIIAAKVAGRLAEVRVDIGDRVTAGALLAEIEPRDAELRVLQSEAAVRAARTLLGLTAEGDDDAIDVETTSSVRLATIALDEARRRKERSLTLSEGGVNSQATLETAESDFQLSGGRLQEAHETVENRRALLAQRRADLVIARQALEDTRIRAPFDGAVVERLANTGEYVSIGTSIARLERDGSLRLRIRVPEQDAAMVHVGQELRARFTGDETVVSAKITRASPELDSNSRVLVAEAELPNADRRRRSGSFAKVQLVLDANARAAVVPIEALVSFAGVEKVFVVNDGHAKETRVDVGRRDAKRIEIVSGLETGAEIVLSPGNLRDGDIVDVERR